MNGARPTISSCRSILRGVTTIEALEETFPLMPVTMYVPGRSATNAPLGSTVAALPLTDQRVMKSPLGSPLTVKRTTSPVRAVFAPAVTVRLRRLFLTTEIVVVALAEPEVALMLALPGPTPVTTPAASTLATCALSEVQLMGTPVRGSPLKIRVTASSGTLLPMTSGVLRGVISIVFTVGVFTIKREKPALPPTIAPTVTSPVPKSFTLPSSSAAAMSKGPAKYVEGFSFTTFPDASIATTAIFTCWPTSASLADAVTCTFLTVAAAVAGLASWARTLKERKNVAATISRANGYLMMRKRITIRCFSGNRLASKTLR